MECIISNKMLRTVLCAFTLLQVTFVNALPVKSSIAKCTIEGRQFSAGEEIDSGFDEQSDRCYGRRCNEHGEIIYWDHFNCFTTPSYSTSSPVPTSTMTTTTAEVPTTTPFGCYEDGIFYAPGEEISNGYDRSSNWCYGSYCDNHGNLLYWDNFRCVLTTTTETTTAAVTTAPSKHIGCIVDGRFYHPGKDIDSGTDHKNWCFGRYCDYHGFVVYWDDFNCGPTTEPTTTIESIITMESTTTTKPITTTEPPCRSGELTSTPVDTTIESITTMESTTTTEPTTTTEFTSTPVDDSNQGSSLF